MPISSEGAMFTGDSGMRWLVRSVFCGGMLLLTACGVPQSDYDALKSENVLLKQELDDLKNGESRLVALIERAYSERKFAVVKSNIAALSERHPDSSHNAKYAALLPEIEAAMAAESAAQLAVAREREKEANRSNTGMWIVANYVDNFGDPTSERFIRNKERIQGKFGNTATEDSELNVVFLIDSASELAIQLYEYAGNNPVKAVRTDEYAVRVKDSADQRYELVAINRSDRLVLVPKDAEVLHAVLLKGGRIQFWIQDVDTPTTQYQFTLQDANYYENAFAQLSAQ